MTYSNVMLRFCLFIPTLVGAVELLNMSTANAIELIKCITLRTTRRLISIPMDFLDFQRKTRYHFRYFVIHASVSYLARGLSCDYSTQ